MLKQLAKQLLNLRVLALLLLSGVLMMQLTVEYRPTGEEWQEFTVEKGIMITKKWNKAATCQLELPRLKSIERANGYADIRVRLDDSYLFDGHTNDRSFDKKKITINAVDRLWDLQMIRRNFYQSTLDITPSQAFTDVFDQNTSFSYFTGEWGESYTDAWLDGYTWVF